MLGLRQRGGWNETVINPVNPHADGADMRVVTSAEEMTIEALKKSGFSEQDAHSPLAITAAGYAANILLAQLREAGVLPNQDLDVDILPLRAFVESFSEIRTRLGLPDPEPMSEEQHARLLGILAGEVRRPEQG